MSERSDLHGNQFLGPGFYTVLNDVLFTEV